MHVQRVEAGKLDHHDVILDMVENHGPVLQFYIREQLVLLVNDPVLVKQVLKEAPNKIPLNVSYTITLIPIHAFFNVSNDLLFHLHRTNSTPFSTELV